MKSIPIGRISIFTVTLLALQGAVSQAQDYGYYGYAYAAPTAYYAPPVMMYQPVMMAPAPVMVPYAAYLAPSPIVYAAPAYVPQPVAAYQPVVTYAPLPGPYGYRERLHANHHELEYKYREYGPGRLGSVYSYKVEAERDGIKIRERIR